MSRRPKGMPTKREYSWHKVNKRGNSRQFTEPGKIEQAEEKEAKAKEWRRKKGIDSDEEDEAEEEDLPHAGSVREEESSEEEVARPKGVQHLIEVDNPNRMGAKSMMKVTEMDPEATTQLSRSEREELEQQEGSRRYRQVLKDKAKSDLARLAVVRERREWMAQKREQERLEKEEEKKNSQTDECS